MQRYVRVTGTLSGKFIEFDFSMGDPLLYVELVLPFEHFKEFCINNNVKHMTKDESVALEYDKLKWRFGDLEFDTNKQKEVNVGGIN